LQIKILAFLIAVKLVSCSPSNEKYAASQDGEVSYLSQFESCEVPKETQLDSILICINPPFIKNLHTLDLNEIFYLQLEVKKQIEEQKDMSGGIAEGDERSLPKYEDVIIIKPARYFEQILISDLKEGAYRYFVFRYLGKDKNELFKANMTGPKMTVKSGDRLSTKVYAEDYGINKEIKGCSLPPEGVYGHFKISSNGTIVDFDSQKSSETLLMSCVPPDA
jgi:hypothetical protein